MTFQKQHSGFSKAEEAERRNVKLELNCLTKEELLKVKEVTENMGKKIAMKTGNTGHGNILQLLEK